MSAGECREVVGEAVSEVGLGKREWGLSGVVQLKFAG